jgi:hypothetical protein
VGSLPVCIMFKETCVLQIRNVCNILFFYPCLLKWLLISNDLTDVCFSHKAHYNLPKFCTKKSF